MRFRFPQGVFGPPLAECYYPLGVSKENLHKPFYDGLKKPPTSDQTAVSVVGLKEYVLA